MIKNDSDTSIDFEEINFAFFTGKVIFLRTQVCFLSAEVSFINFHPGETII